MGDYLWRKYVALCMHVQRKKEQAITGRGPLGPQESQSKGVV